MIRQRLTSKSSAIGASENGHLAPSRRFTGKHHSLSYYFKKLLRPVRMTFWRIEGTELNSGQALSLLCAVNRPDRNYIARLIFGSEYSEKRLGEAFLWDMNKYIKESDQACAMLLIKTEYWQERLLNRANWFIIPRWIEGRIELPLSVNNKSFKSDLRRIRKHNLGYKITCNPDSFDTFYNQMHIPYIKKAHECSSYIIPYDTMRKEFSDCELLMIRKGNREIAGILINYSEAIPRMRSIGILNAEKQYLNDGAVAALYYFSCQYLCERGYSTVNCGRSRAFLKDGVLRYKRKWSQEIFTVSSNSFALKILSDSDATQAFLRNNPFIFNYQNSPNGALFLNDEHLTADRLEEIHKEYYHPDLSRLIITQNGDDIPKLNVPELLKDEILLKSCGNLSSGA